MNKREKIVEVLKSMRHVNFDNPVFPEDVEEYINKQADAIMEMDEWEILSKDNLPMMLALDYFTGGTPVLVYHPSKGFYVDKVGDHDVWYYEMKDAGITHWKYLSPPKPKKQ